MMPVPVEVQYAAGTAILGLAAYGWHTKISKDFLTRTEFKTWVEANDKLREVHLDKLKAEAETIRERIDELAQSIKEGRQQLSEAMKISAANGEKLAELHGVCVRMRAVDPDRCDRP